MTAAPCQRKEELKVHSEEVFIRTDACKIVDIRSIGSKAREKRRMEKLNTFDRRFRELSPNRRRHVLYHVIGYCEAMADGITAGRASMDDEISRIVKMIETSIYESGNGGIL